MIRRMLAAATLVVAAFALVACSGDEGPTPAGPTAGPDTPVTTTPGTPGGTSDGTPGTPGGTPGTPGGTAGGTPTDGGNVPAPVAPNGRRLELAPIEGLDVLVRESFPPQYAAVVKYGLPSGCAVYAGTEVQRTGDVITLTVWNTMPSDQNIACTMIYGIGEDTINLGSDFEPGKLYTVKAGDREVTFTAQ